jgi:hypothetical protein
VRVFISHTRELTEYPLGRSYVDQVVTAVSACGHVVVEMDTFPVRDGSSAALCEERLSSADVYLGVFALRYGSPVRDKPHVSHTELEFDYATKRGLTRLVFVLDENSVDHGIPPKALVDDHLDRQREFRRRVDDADLVRGSFRNPDHLGRLVERALRDHERDRSGPSVPTSRVDVPPVSRAMVARPAKLDEVVARLLGGSDVTVTSLRGAGGVGKSVLAQQVGHDSRIHAHYRGGVWWLPVGDAPVLEPLTV